MTRPAGASIAIDDCYELWESGFISIPFDFQVCGRQAPQAGTRLLSAALASMSVGDGGPKNAYLAMQLAGPSLEYFPARFAVLPACVLGWPPGKMGLLIFPMACVLRGPIGLTLKPYV